MKKLSVILFVISIAVLFTGSTFAQKRMANGFGQGRMFTQLDLSDSQKSEIEKLRYEHQMKAIDLRAELKKNKIEIENLLNAEKVDENAVMNLVEKNNEIHNSLSKMRMEMRIKVGSLLTTEQKELLDDFPGFSRGFRHGMSDEPGSLRGRGMQRGNCGEPKFRCNFF